MRNAHLRKYLCDGLGVVQICHLEHETVRRSNGFLYGWPLPLRVGGQEMDCSKQIGTAAFRICDAPQRWFSGLIECNRLLFRLRPARAEQQQEQHDKPDQYATRSAFRP